MLLCLTLCIYYLQKSGFDNLKKGTEIWQIILAVFIFHMLGLYVIEQNMYLSNVYGIKFDIIVSLIMGILLILIKLDIRKKYKGILGFIQNHYLKFAIAIIFLLDLAGIIVNTSYSMEIIRREGSGIKQNDYSFLLNTYNSIVEKLKESDTSVYRVENKKQLTINDALNFGYNGISHSASTYSKPLHDFLEKMGMKSTHVHLTYNCDTLKSVNMLLGIKYFIMPKDANLEELEEYNMEYAQDTTNEISRVYKAKYPLSIGYAVSKNIENVNMNTSNIFSIQNSILKNMSNMDEDVYIEQKGKIKQEGSNGDLELTYEFQVESDKDIYIYMDTTYSSNVEIYCNDEKLGDYFNLTDNELIHLGKKQIGETINLKLKMKDVKYIDNIYIYYEDEEVLEKYYNELKQTQVDLRKINNTNYEGKVNIEQDNDEYVFFTIPYDDGWKVTVDGKDTEAEKVLDAMLAVKVEKGEHVIELRYTLPRI